MNFKNFLSDLAEGIIIPNKIVIKSNDIKKLNKQFKDTIISFEYDTGEHAAYLPQFNKIKVYITKDTPHHVIEALVQHEVIHSIQDKKSGNRMQADIEAQYAIVRGYLDELDDLDDEDEVDGYIAQELMNKIKKAQIKAQHLNDEERQAYAYMFVKLRGSNNIKEVLKQANEHWVQFTGQKMDNKLKKYFASYWMVREKL